MSGWFKAKGLRNGIGGALVAALVLAVSAAANAGTTGTINITGTIPTSCNVTVTPQAIASSLDLTTTQSALTVASVTEACNNKTGYNVTIATANGTTGGLMKGLTGNNDTVAYSVTYNGVGQTFASGSATATNTSVKSPAGGVSKSLAISYTGAPSINAGTYTDVLTLTMTVN